MRSTVRSRYAGARAVAVLLLALAPGAAAQTSDARAAAVIAEADRRVSGFGDFTATLTMTLRDADGGERTRAMRVEGLEVPGDGTRTLLTFDTPRDLRGTSVLTVSGGDGRTEQWLYLPAVRRARRIASADRSDAFMGSEFTYEDIDAQDFDGYAYRHLREEPLGSGRAHVLERTPLGGDSGYARQVLWLDTDEYRVQRIEYHGPDGRLLKVLEVDGYRPYGERLWRADRMVMTDPTSGRSTVLAWSDYAFGTGLQEADFDPRRLGRPR